MSSFPGIIAFCLLAGAMAFGQTGTSFSPVNPQQTQVPAQDNSASPANSTNPAASTLPVPPSSRVSGAAATGSEPSTNATPAVTTPASSTSAGPSTGSPAAAGSESANSGTYTSNGSSTASSGTYAHPITPVEEIDVQVPANTEMRAVLDTPLSTRTSKAGDRFTATVVDSVRGSNGSIAFPAGTRVEGEVTEAEPGKVKPATTTSAISALKGKGKLSLRFRDAILPTGQTVSLNTSLVSVNSTAGNNIRSGSDVRNNGSAANSSFGAPLKGFAVGTLAGGGHILAVRSKDVDLPARTGMVIRFDPPLTSTESTPQQ